MQVVAFLLFDVRPDARETFVAAATEVMRATWREAGCIVYRFGADLSDPHRFQITEVWESQDALDAHHGTDHAGAARAVIAEIATVAEMKLWSADLAAIAPGEAGSDAAS